MFRVLGVKDDIPEAEVMITLFQLGDALDDGGHGGRLEGFIFVRRQAHAMDQLGVAAGINENSGANGPAA